MQGDWQVFGGALGSGCFSEVGFVIAGIKVVAVRKPDAVDVAPQFRPEKTVFDDSDPFVSQVFVEHDLNSVPIFITWIDRFGNGAGEPKPDMETVLSVLTDLRNNIDGLKSYDRSVMWNAWDNRPEKN